jgi:hypothetical protein
MKAIRVHHQGGPEVLQLEDVPDPTPGPGEVVVRIEAAGVNFIEIYQRKGQYAMTLPFTPGGEGAGTVAAVGPGVAGLKAGDRVASQSFRGSYAELSVAAADRLVRIPDGVSTKTAAAALLQGLTAHYLTMAKGSRWCTIPSEPPRSKEAWTPWRLAGCWPSLANRAARWRPSIPRFSTGRARSFSPGRPWFITWQRGRNWYGGVTISSAGYSTRQSM